LPGEGRSALVGPLNVKDRVTPAALDAGHVRVELGVQRQGAGWALEVEHPCVVVRTESAAAVGT